jgi:hypothetical protein
MTVPLWVGLAVLAAAAFGMIAVRIPPERRLAAALLAGAAVLALLRVFALAVPLAAIGIGLWQRASRGIPSPGGKSAVETAALRMTLDHGSGTMDGEVIAGRFAERWLSELSAEELRALADELEAAGDDDSLSLLLAYLDRKGVGRDAPATPSGPPMTEAEAYRVLGLEPGASVEEIRAAYHRLIRRVHPDLGGSSALAAMLNAAKDLLDPG